MERSFLWIRLLTSLVFAAVALKGVEAAIDLYPSAEQYLAVDASFSVTCEVSGGNNPRWYDPSGREVLSLSQSGFDTRRYVERSAAEMAILWFEQIRDSDKGTYTCEFRSDTATIKIDVVEPIDFSYTPTTQYLTKGEDGFIVCDVTSNPASLLTWKFNNYRINEGRHYNMEERGLRVNGVTMRDRGTYTCVARIKETGDVAQKDIEVEVYATPSRTTWVRPPRDIKGHEGQKIILECQLSNTKGLKHRWLRHSTYLTDNGRSIFDEYTVLDDGNGRSTLVIKNAAHTDNAVFTCEHILAIPQRMSARVNVLSPFASVELIPSGPGTYSCNATHGSPGANKIHWIINDKVVASVKPWSIEEDDGYFSSGSVYEVGSDVRRGDGNFKLTCEVFQSMGEEGQSQSIDLPANQGEASRPNKNAVALVFVVMVILQILG